MNLSKAEGFQQSLTAMFIIFLGSCVSTKVGHMPGVSGEDIIIIPESTRYFGEQLTFYLNAM